MRVLVQHESRYEYDEPAALGPHLVRLRPAPHAEARIERYALTIEPEHTLRWQQDPAGNWVARVSFPSKSRVRALGIKVELALDLQPVNPFDFFIDDRCRQVPFAYPDGLPASLGPYLRLDDPALATGKRFEALLAELPAKGTTVDFVVAANSTVNKAIRYVIRDEAGVWTPEETLEQGRGSCRDSAILLCALLRRRGLATRFVSGYLVQVADEGMLPDEPKGIGRDVVDLHAWAEVFVPGAGWIGLDATSGLLTGEGHLPLACTATPSAAAPIEGTSDRAASAASFSMRIGRVGHEPRPTAPYTDEAWRALLAAADDADARLASLGITLTSGGEPTFNSREHPNAPEWNGEALGETKWTQGLRLAAELRRRLCPGAAVIERPGKHYPGEPLPRWALDLIARTDGTALWTGETRPFDREGTTVDDARRVAESIAGALGIETGLQPAYEDPWRFVQDEQNLPLGVDPLKADLDDPAERRRLAKVLGHGLGRAVGYVLPVTRAGAWKTERWTFRRGHLFLIPGDSSIGLRLPLKSLPGAPPPPLVELSDARDRPPDPRLPEDAQLRWPGAAPVWLPAGAVRTALCVEARGGSIRVFLPPVATAEDFCDLVRTIDEVRALTKLPVLLEGYPPPPSPLLQRFAVTPDPGVLEVNVPPSSSSRAHAELLETVFDAALHSGLQGEKYLSDGRLAGSGGGHHLTMGGPTPRQSPFIARPELLGSLLTLVQHHPSLSYLFTGLFVGPTSQAPRVDEARHDSLYEMEIALSRLFQGEANPPPWIADYLLRHVLVDVAGSTHRAEVSIDKLWDWQTPYGRQGLVELRAFEMPPHPHLAAAQAILARALVSALAHESYRAPLVRWGQTLHDRFLLPHYLWRDFEDVLGAMAARGVALPAEGYRPFLELRCPIAGTATAGDVLLEVRNALEPWHVLGEEVGGGGTARYVDSSLERVQVRAVGLIPERHVVLVNGHQLPLRQTGTAHEAVGGVRFRAWAPPHSMQPHLGIHHPLRFDVVDTWAKRAMLSCAYHVWHPEGRAYVTPPLTRFEASARRAQRFTIVGEGTHWPAVPRPAPPHADAPYTLDLRRFSGDRPVPEFEEE